MSHLVFFALGGTGMRSVEPLLHLCALGLGPDRLSIVLVDPDQTHPGGTRALELLKVYQEIRDGLPRPEGRTYFGTDIRLATNGIGIWSPIALPVGTHVSAVPRFTSLVDADLMRQRCQYLGHLFDLLYDPTDEQQMGLEKGFRGRPSIGTVFMSRIARESWLRELMTDRDATFFAAGSIFGGTGASALPVVSEVLRKGFRGDDGSAPVQGVEPARLGAALVLPFFQPVNGPARAADDGLMPDPALFTLNALGAAPYYTELRAGFSEMFVIGEDVWRRVQAGVGGEDQPNTAHHVELLVALAALRFADGNRKQHTDAKFFVASASSKDVAIEDLPISQDEQVAIRAGVVWAHTILNYFGTAEGVDPSVCDTLRGATWLREIGLSSNDLLQPRIGNALSGLCSYAAYLWNWAGEVSDQNASPRLLLRAGTDQSAAETPLLNVLCNRGPLRKGIRADMHGREVFGHWNTVAASLRKRGEGALLQVMQRGSVAATEQYFAVNQVKDQAEHRLLLPTLEAGNIAREPGKWADITKHRHNLKRIRSQNDSTGVRMQLGSIPSPWSRMYLFEDALMDPEHPARESVSTEMLDILELMWSRDAQPHDIVLRQFRISDLVADARLANTAGAEEFANALTLLFDGRNDAGVAAEITLVLSLDARQVHRPIAASSVRTAIFTGVDVRRRIGRIGKGLFAPDVRPIGARPIDFQWYVRDRLDLPPQLAPWHAAIKEATSTKIPVGEEYECEPHPNTFSGTTLLRKTQEVRLPSRWRLWKPDMDLRARPYVVDPATFDQQFYEGAPESSLPDEATLASLKPDDRRLLYGTRIEGTWCSPCHHWFTSSLVLVSNPVSKDKVYGFSKFRREGTENGSLAQANAQFLLPLRREIFDFYTPSDIDRVLSITVTHSGDVRARLDVELERPGSPSGFEKVTFEKVYAASDIVRNYQEIGSGSEIAVWPSFYQADWKDYLVFRRDESPGFADRVTMDVYRRGAVGGPTQTTVTRTKAARVVGLEFPPEILGFHMPDGMGAKSELGVVLPRFSHVQMNPNMPHWDVAVDFGTSNTTVCRSAEPGHYEVVQLSATAQMLNDSKPLEGVLDKYFMPPELPAGRERQMLYFQTALVTHITYKPEAVPNAIPGMYSHIPWRGAVDGDENHRVFGDLKWVGADNVESQARVSSFMRQLLAAISASARLAGVQRVTLHWSYPGAYSDDQAGAIGALWSAASQSTSVGVTPRYAGASVIPHNERLHESACTLEYFRAVKKLQVEKGVLVVLDVGGGTTDISVYADNRPALFDSVLMGGRNLTGNHDLKSNAFVAALLKAVETRTATTTESGPDSLKTIVAQAQVYQQGGHDHLAFSHLVGSAAFQQVQGMYTALDVVKNFRPLVLYMFGALFYHVGMALAGTEEASGQAWTGQLKVAIAGNGSKYLGWVRMLSTDSGFVDFMKACITRGARMQPDVAARLLDLGPGNFLTVTDEPKKEVAKGILAMIAAHDSSFAIAGMRPTLGEAICVGATTYRRGTSLNYALKREHLSELDFLTEEPLELSEFTAFWIDAVRGLYPNDTNFQDTVNLIRQTSINRSDIVESVTRRISESIGLYREWNGSIFMIEVDIMLRLMMTKLFG